MALPHLYFTDTVLESFDTHYKLFPPIREASDRQALREALLDGTIDVVSAMHEPVNIEYKKVEFNHALDGSLGLEAAFGTLNSIFTLEKTIDFLTRGRERFNITPTKIEVGAAVDLSLFAPDEQYILEENRLHSTSKNCAFLGISLNGKVYGSMRNDKISWNE